MQCILAIDYMSSIYTESLSSRIAEAGAVWDMSWRECEILLD